MKKSIAVFILSLFIISFVNAADLDRKIDFLKEKALELNGTGRAVTRFVQGDEDADDGDIIFDVLDYIQKMHNDFPDVLDNEKLELLESYINTMGKKYNTYIRSGGVVSKDELYDYLLEDLEKIIEEVMMVSEYEEELNRQILNENSRNNMQRIQEPQEPVEEMESEEQEFEENAQRISIGKIIARNGAFMRKGPSTSYGKIMGVAFGTQVKIIEENSNWYYVELGNTRGYIYKTLIEITQVTDEVSDDEENSELNATIKVSRANVRKGPGSNYSIVTTLKYGDNVKITGKKGNWYSITFNNSNGYIYSELVFVDEEESSLGKARVIVSAARVRKGPGTNYSTLTILKNGDIVELISNASNTWYYIKMEDGKYGYTAKSLVQKIDEDSIQDDSTPVSGTNNPQKQAYVCVNAANIRKGPGTNHGKLTTLLRGTVVNVLEEGEDWTKIRLNDGREGYVYSSLIAEEDNSGTAISDAAERITHYALGAVNQSDVIYGTDCYNADTAHGKLACAAVVSAILKKSDVGFNSYKIYCPYLRDYLTQVGFKRVNPGSWKRGDVVFWTKRSGDRPRHVGVVVQKDVYGKWWAVDNSTSRLKVLKRPLLRSYYPVVLPGRRK